MPLITPASGFGRIAQQTTKAGVTVTASASINTKGNYVTLIDPLSFDTFGLHLRLWGVHLATTNTCMLLDIAVAPTGGGSEQVVIPNIDAGAASTSALGHGKGYFFPLFIPAGKAIRARCQGVIASDIVTVAAHAFQMPPHGYAEDSPQEWETYGADTSASRGTAVTSGSGAFGTEVDVTGGSGTARDHRWFHVGIDWGTNTSISLGVYRVRLSRDTAAADVIGIWDFAAATTGEDMVGPWPSFPVCFPVPAGSLLRVDIDGAASEAVSAIVHAA